MFKKPIYNSLSATLYIIVVVSLMNYVSQFYIDENVAQYIAPIIMLSLFTLSVAVMGYLFFTQPIMLFMEGKKEVAVKFFLKTVLMFAGITVSILLAYLLVVGF